MSQIWNNCFEKDWNNKNESWIKELKNKSNKNTYGHFSLNFRAAMISESDDRGDT